MLHNKDKKKEEVIIKPGMEVQLHSPTTEHFVALGTVQTDRSFYYDVTINMVLNSTTRLPIPKGRLQLLGHAEAHTVQWPKIYVSITK